MIGLENGLGFVVFGVVMGMASPTPVAAVLPESPAVAAPAPASAVRAPAPVAAASPRPAPASAPRVAAPNPCPVQSWQYGAWTTTHPIGAHSNPGQPTDYIYGTIPAGSKVVGCIRPDGWVAVAGYGWVSLRDLS